MPVIRISQNIVLCDALEHTGRYGKFCDYRMLLRTRGAHARRGPSVVRQKPPKKPHDLPRTSTTSEPPPFSVHRGNSRKNCKFRHTDAEDTVQAPMNSFIFDIFRSADRHTDRENSHRDRGNRSLRHTDGEKAPINTGFRLYGRAGCSQNTSVSLVRISDASTQEIP